MLLSKKSLSMETVNWKRGNYQEILRIIIPYVVSKKFVDGNCKLKKRESARNSALILNAFVKKKFVNGNCKLKTGELSRNSPLIIPYVLPKKLVDVNCKLKKRESTRNSVLLLYAFVTKSLSIKTVNCNPNISLVFGLQFPRTDFFEESMKN